MIFSNHQNKKKIEGNNQDSLTSTTNPPSMSAAGSSKQHAFRELRTTFKKTFSTASKDVTLLVIPSSEFVKNYQHIVLNYNRNEATKFLSFETSLMLVRFYLQSSMRAEALHFINDAIYVNNLNIEETARIRRYLEIGKFYADCRLTRLAALYKWISANRVFGFKERLRQQSPAMVDTCGFKCLVRRLILQFADLFTGMKICEQQAPSVLMQSDQFQNFNAGFPVAKKYILSQLVDLLYFYKSRHEMIKYVYI
jgi:hypothetical protein